MKVSVLASGSEGNSTYLETKNHKILIDLGMNVKYIKEKLQELDILPEQIDLILITHVHKDHIGALDKFIKKYQPTVCLSQKMFQEIDYIHDYEHIIIYDDQMVFENLTIEIFKTSHDTSDSRGFVITSGNSSLVYVTDTGYINQKYFKIMKNKNMYIFESNHDGEMLMNGKYPEWLKKRVVGPKGHLSNRDSSIYLSKLIGSNTQKIILAHLSKENNTEEEALKTISEVFNEYQIPFNNIECAKQREKTKVVTI